MRKSASFPGESEPNEENKPSDNAPFLVAALRVCSYLVKILDAQRYLTNLVAGQTSRLCKGHLGMVHQADWWLSMCPDID